MTTYRGMHKNYTIEEPRLAKGGEGEIFSIRGHRDLVLKRFYDNHRTTTRLRKLEAMIRAGVPQQLLPQLTWPVDIVYEGGKFIGYVMPALTKTENLNVLYSDKYSLTLEERVIVARNLCVPVDALHQLGQYVGDGNPQNICVDPKNLTVTLVDTDSYSISDKVSGRIYPCVVGLGTYLAPEVQRAISQHHGLMQVPPDTFNEYTDRFWLAVHIFALLMNGAHPFAVRAAGQAPIPHMSSVQSSVNLPQPNENIGKGYFPHAGLKPGHEIPVYCPKMDYLPESTKHMFRRAFVEGHTNPVARPSAREWFGELIHLRGTLISRKHCWKKEHQYPRDAAFCPWCELEQRAIPKQVKNYVVSPPASSGTLSSGMTASAGGTGVYPGSGTTRQKNGCLRALGILLGCLLSLAVLLTLPVACTANLIDIHQSEQAARQEAVKEKIEELRESIEDSAPSEAPQNPPGPSIHYNECVSLLVDPAEYYLVDGTVSDTAPEAVFLLNPQLNGTYCLDTVTQDQQLFIRVYDDTEGCIGSFFSEDGDECISMELEAGRLYTLKVERRFADTGAFQLRWWLQKPCQDITYYGEVSDSMEFTDQINTYEFRCAASKTYRFFLLETAPDLTLSMSIYDSQGNRITSGIDLEAGFGPYVELEHGQTYTIHVNAYNGLGAYTLQVQRIEA